MMQEEEEIRSGAAGDDHRDVDPGEDVAVVGGRAVSASYSVYSKFHGNQKYKIYYFEILAACIIGLSTFSGGILEGYTSPALPSLLKIESLPVSTTTVTGNATNNITESIQSPSLQHVFDNSFGKTANNTSFRYKRETKNNTAVENNTVVNTRDPKLNVTVNITSTIITNTTISPSIPINNLKGNVTSKMDITPTIKSIESSDFDILGSSTIKVNERKAIDLATISNNTSDIKDLNQNVSTNNTIIENPNVGNVNTANKSIVTNLPVNIDLFPSKDNTTTLAPRTNISGTIDKTNEENIINESVVNNQTNFPTLSPISTAINTTIPPIFKPNLTSTNETEHSDSDIDVKFQLTEEEASWLGSLLLLGACVGSCVSSWVVSFGRRRSVLGSAIPRFIGWILIAAASNLQMMYAGRFLTGISVGIITSAAPLYISEVSHPSTRGSLSCLVQLGVNVGIFFVSLLGTFMYWRSLAIVGTVSVVVYFVGTLFIPDSPSWLVLRGREAKARSALKQLRGPHYDIEAELQQVVATVQKCHSVHWRELISERRCFVPLCVVGVVTLINRFSGYNAIITYCASFIHKAVPSVSQYWAATSVTLMQVFATIAAALLIDRLGRRWLLLASVSVMAVSLITIAICEVLGEDGAGGSVIAVLATMLYVGSYSIGIGPVTWVLVGEMFPLDARDKASAVIAFLNWLTAFIVTKTYFELESVIGIAGTCFVYAIVCLIGLFVIYFLVPETKGRTLSEIEAHFSYSVTRGPWRTGASKNDLALSSILDHDSGSLDTYSTFHQYNSLG